MSSPIFCSIDTPSVEKANETARRVAPHVGGLKLGLELYLSAGRAAYQALSAYNLPIFLDLKLHDIPNTVAGAVRSIASLNPSFLTIHASGGKAMMQAAADAAEKRIKLLGVSVLTSLDENDLTSIGQKTPIANQVCRLAELAQESGLDGLICSPAEIALVRSIVSPQFILMVPGIRLDKSTMDDQKRTMTPREAIDAGATHLVIGRPITAALDPAEAAAQINASLYG